MVYGLSAFRDCRIELAVVSGGVQRSEYWSQMLQSHQEVGARTCALSIVFQCVAEHVFMHHSFGVSESPVHQCVSN